MKELGEQGRPVSVYIVNPPIQDPWRTQGEYRDDQRGAQHVYRVAVVSMIVATFRGGAAAVGAIAALRPSAPQAVKVECVAAAPAPGAAPARPK